jgi:hypothetical protein
MMTEYDLMHTILPTMMKMQMKHPILMLLLHAMMDTRLMHTKGERENFRRKYLQPQPKPKKKRNRRKNTFEQNLNIAVEEGWNGVIKNFSGEPVTEVERSLLSKGQKFCPVELDPPILRMQRELHRFYRILRIKWFFDDQPNKQSELEKVFYPKI